MESTYKAVFTEIREQAEANPQQEARATGVLHRIAALYREAVVANDWQAVKGITEEFGRCEVKLGQSIAQARVVGSVAG